MADSFSNVNVNYFPQQKITAAAKDNKWACQCIDAATNIIFNRQDWVRQSMYNKKINYDLANNIINENDIHKVFNPLGIQYGEFPISIQHFNKSMNKINLLIGEEYKRQFEWRVSCLNPDIVNSKQQAKLDGLMEIATATIQSNTIDPNEIQKKLKDLEIYHSYNYQDIREQHATNIMNYHWWIDRFAYKFNRGYMDALIAGEEIYRTDIISHNPIMEKCNPINIFALRNGDSQYFEDAEIIVELAYLPVGKVIEEFYEELTPQQIDLLEKGYQHQWTTSNMLQYTSSAPTFTLPNDYLGTQNKTGLVEPNINATRWFGGWFNEYGDVRVIRTRWKSRQKRYIRTYFDEYGFEQQDIVSEYYTANEDLGETLKEIWIDQWWEGTKVGADIYLKVQPRPVQFGDINNPSISKSGYVGTYYNVNTSRAISLMDRMRPFQYLYNILWHKMLHAISIYKGPKEVMNLSLKPASFTEEQWLYYSDQLGKLMIDPFNPALEGFATGKLAGQFNQFLPTIIDASSFGNYISQLQGLIEYVDKQIGEISGISKEREGQVSSNQTVGGAERNVQQSAYITEYYFLIHEDTKLRVMEAFLDTARIAYKGKNLKLSYITDDLGELFFEFDGDQFAESNYGIKIINSNKIVALQQKLDMLVQAGLQNDKITFSQAIKLYNTTSISQMEKEITEFETSKLQDQQQQQQDEMKHKEDLQNQQLQIQQQIHQDTMNLEHERLQNDMDKKLLDMELGKDKLGQDNELTQLELRIAEQQSRLNSMNEQKRMDLDRKIHDDTVQLEHKKINQVKNKIKK